jgi:hypothetical protein
MCEDRRAGETGAVKSVTRRRRTLQSRLSATPDRRYPIYLRTPVEDLDLFEPPSLVVEIVLHICFLVLRNYPPLSLNITAVISKRLSGTGRRLLPMQLVDMNEGHVLVQRIKSLTTVENCIRGHYCLSCSMLHETIRLRTCISLFVYVTDALHPSLSIPQHFSISERITILNSKEKQSPSYPCLIFIFVTNFRDDGSVGFLMQRD